MDKKVLKQFIVLITITMVTFGLSISLQSLLAQWTPPAQSPPQGGPSYPIYSASSSDQRIASGGLVITGGNLTAFTVAGINVVATSSFRAGSASQFRIDSSGNLTTTGNIGVGQPSPSSPLEVNGDIEAVRICDENHGNCQDLTTLGAGGALNRGIPVYQCPHLMIGETHNNCVGQVSWQNFCRYDTSGCAWCGSAVCTPIGNLVAP